MIAQFRNRATAVWLVLIAATAISFATAQGEPGANRVATLIVLLVAFVKVRFIGLEFMELRKAPLPLRLLFEAWIAVVGSTLVVVCWLGYS